LITRQYFFFDLPNLHVSPLSGTFYTAHQKLSLTLAFFLRFS
jgi:hypothetical protein